MNASISPRANICIDSATGRVTQSTSRRGSSPTWASMLARKMCRPDPRAETATRFPFKSRRERMRSLPNSSKHPMWMPASIVNCSPASSRVTSDGTGVMLKSASPLATALTPSMPVAFFTCSWVKPSPLSNSWAGIRVVPVQISAGSITRILSVSGGGSAAIACAPAREGR